MSLDQVWVPTDHIFVDISCSCNHRHRVGDEDHYGDWVVFDEAQHRFNRASWFFLRVERFPACVRVDAVDQISQ